MTTSGKTIVKNASVMLVAQLITWGLTFLLTIFQPRLLGPAATGELYLAVALWSLAGVFISFGMDTYLTIMIARNPATSVDLLGTSLWLRVFIYPVCAVIITLFMLVEGYSPQTILVVHLIGLSVVIWQLIAGVQAVLQGLEIMQYISLATIISKAINTFFGIAVLLLGFGLLSLSAVMIAAALVCLALQIYYLNREHHISLKLRVPDVKPMIVGSLPFVVGRLVHSVYQYVNTVILGAQMDSTQVGWFSTSATLFGTLLFLPVVFGTVLFPALSRAHEQNPAELPILFRKAVDLLLLMSVPIGLGIIAIARPVVDLIYGPEFAPSAPVLQVLGVTLIFMYFNILMGEYFAAIDRQNTWTAFIAGFTVVMVAVTVTMIPVFNNSIGNGAVGAAVGLLVAEAGMMLGGMVLLRKLFRWANLWTALRVLFVGFLMMGAVWLLHDTFVLVQILGGGLVYVLGIALLRVLPAEDLSMAREMVQGLLRKVRRQPISPESTGA